MASYMNPMLSIASFNCRGYNLSKQQYISSLLDKFNFLFLQEHWLSDAQLNVLGNIHANIFYSGISGFGNSEVLTGRPYGGCAILWHSNILANDSSIEVASRRLCAVLVAAEDWKLVLINAYMPNEDDDVKSDEFVHNSSLIEEIIGQHGDCHVIIGGDFNVDFNRCSNHTRILSSFL